MQAGALGEQDGECYEGSTLFQMGRKEEGLRILEKVGRADHTAS
jgi:hypothetical protein